MLAVKKWNERKESIEELENDIDDDIYAVNDDESDNEDVTMVTDTSSDLQETSLMAHVSGKYP